MLGSLLQETKPDVIFAPAGVVSQSDLTKNGPHLKHIVWCVEQTSRHMDFLEPEVGNNGSTYYDLVEKNKEGVTSQLPTDTDINNAPDVVSVWQSKNTSSYEIVEFKQAVSIPSFLRQTRAYRQQNIIAGVAAQIAALHRDMRYESKDLVVSLEPLTLMFPLTIFLAAMFSHASIAFTSVAGSAPDFDLAFQRIKPTVVIASAETIAQAQARKTKENQSLFQKLHNSRQASSLAAGTMRGANTIFNQQCPRLIFTSERAGGGSVPLTSQELSDVRVFTGSRVVYALTAAKVAGAIAQTHVYDYRPDPKSRSRSHFGAPLSSIELKVVEQPQQKIADEGYDNPSGWIVVSGPAVVGGTVNTGVVGTFGDDHTLSLE